MVTMSNPMFQRLSRRQWLSNTAQFSGGLLLSAATPLYAQSSDHAVVETISGRVRGLRTNGIYSFKGIHYGANTGGANRWLPPQAVAPWSGIKDSIAYGPRAPQNERPALEPHLAWIRDGRPLSEDCLVLNVFTPAIHDQGRRPVLVYIHGGGFVSGASSAPGLDGHHFAQRGDVVMVSLNHRLNVFGHLSLALDAGEAYRDAGNVGMLDIIQALQWVRQHISQFGGDPNNVTISGQSGGASKVAVLMAMPQARGLFHKAIVQSASSLLRMATPDEAQRNTYYLLKQLNLDESHIKVLREMPVATLLAAMQKAVAAAGRVDNYRPVVDGRALPTHPFDPSAASISRDIPMMIGSCENEMTFPYSQVMENFQYNESQALAKVQDFVGVDEAQARQLMQLYRRSRPQASASDLWVAISTDHQYRRNVIKASELKSDLSAAPSWHYLFTWKTPVLNGLLKSPHTICIPFSFGNVDIASGITGSSPERYALQHAMMDAWYAFMRTGNPNHAGIPKWQPYHVQQHPTMLWDNTCRVVDDPAREERMAMSAMPAYRADGSRVKSS